MAENQGRRVLADPEIRLFALVLGYQLLLLLILGTVVYLVWNKPDPIIMYVPVYVLVWGAIGGVVSVLYKLLSHPGGGALADFLRLAIVKPAVGAVLGAVAFFAAEVGLVVVSKSAQVTTNNELLCLIAFLGGFSDRFTLDIIDRLAQRGSARRKPEG